MTASRQRERTGDNVSDEAGDYQSIVVLLSYGTWEVGSHGGFVPGRRRAGRAETGQAVLSPCRCGVRAGRHWTPPVPPPMSSSQPAAGALQPVTALHSSALTGRAQLREGRDWASRSPRVGSEGLGRTGPAPAGAALTAYPSSASGCSADPAAAAAAAGPASSSGGRGPRG